MLIRTCNAARKAVRKILESRSVVIGLHSIKVDIENKRNQSLLIVAIMNSLEWWNKTFPEHAKELPLFLV